MVEPLILVRVDVWRGDVEELVQLGPQPAESVQCLGRHAIGVPQEIHFLVGVYSQVIELLPLGVEDVENVGVLTVSDPLEAEAVLKLRSRARS